MDAKGWTRVEAFSGGCQCGALRYEVAAGQAFASICHCRMCQRAVGSPFSAFVKVATSTVVWHGEPAVFASSDIAERGFCRACGTPLFYRKINDDWIELSSGSLAPSVPFVPVQQWGTEGRHSWLDGLDIPGAETNEPTLTSFQSAPEDM